MFVAPQQQQQHREPPPATDFVEPMGFGEEDAPQDATSHGLDSAMNSSNEKVTDQDLQRFMQQRNASPASANPNNTPM